MDPLTIAAAVGALLAPYVKKGAEAFAGEAGKYVFGKARSLWESLRAKLAHDPQAAATMDRFERDPDGERQALETQVEKHATADTALRDELAAAIAELKRQAPQVKVVQQIEEAEKVVGLRAKRLRQGTVDVEQDVGKAGDVIGGEFDEIG